MFQEPLGLARVAGGNLGFGHIQSVQGEVVAEQLYCTWAPSSVGLILHAPRLDAPAKYLPNGAAEFSTF